MPLARIITPNIPEAETLLGGTISSLEDMQRSAEMLMTMGPDAVLVKGGHMSGSRLTDVLLNDDGFHLFETKRVETGHTHGTGCTTASAIATGIAQGFQLPAAVKRAQSYVAAAIRGAPGIGQGHGPIDHGHTVGHFDGK
jgi:hydroxymethylpyrimidine/phosphomethylpyrimidine kinase